MDNHLPLDYGQQDLQEGDRLLLSSDGVHDFLSREAISEILSREGSAEKLTRTLLDEALNHGSDDNISAVVALVESLPSENLDDYSQTLTHLPFPPELEPGMKLDGYLVEKELFSSSRSQLYLVRDLDSGQVLAMKTPSRNFDDDLSYIDRFIQEEWIGSRISSPNVVRVMRQQRPRSALYYLMEYVEGIGLDHWIETHQPPSPKRAILIVKQIVKGLQAFHDNEAIHQDLKPANVLICDAESETPRAVIVDFGSVYVAGLAELQRPLEHEGALGTVSYSDPMYMLGKHPGLAGDVYALATITYEIFTGALPYGDKVEDCRSAKDYDRLRYVSASELNPIIPVWFDGALEKGVHFDLEQRYATVGDLLQDLTQPNADFLREDPVAERKDSTELFWKLISGFWFLTLVLVIYLFYQVS
jgi:protein phosphatase